MVRLRAPVRRRAVPDGVPTSQTLDAQMGAAACGAAHRAGTADARTARANGRAVLACAQPRLVLAAAGCAASGLAAQYTGLRVPALRRATARCRCAKRARRISRCRRATHSVRPGLIGGSNSKRFLEP